MQAADIDIQVRLAAFEFLANHRRTYGEVFPPKVLRNDFHCRGQRVPLKGIQGIFKPAILELPISITTAPPQEGRPAPYDDGFTKSGGSTAKVGFEAKLWGAAGALRNKMDAAEYRHVVLGLVSGLGSALT